MRAAVFFIMTNDYKNTCINIFETFKFENKNEKVWGFGVKNIVDIFEHGYLLKRIYNAI